MHFEVTSDPEHPYRITFEGEEIQVVNGAFREIIYERMMKGNAGSVSKFDIYMAEYSLHKKACHVSRVEIVTDPLDTFHEKTSEEVYNMPETTGEPAFSNGYMVLRAKLGMLAFGLSNQIKDAAAPPLEDPEQVVREFREQLDSHDQTD